MYARLTLRNVCRSGKQYALYLTTMTLLTVLIAFSNLLAGAGSGLGGAEASSLPLIIALIMAVLLHYINGFMLRRRGRELATYILLGINKRTISVLFFGETFLLGLACFLVGTAVGSTAFSLVISLTGAASHLHYGMWFYRDAAAASFLYFLGVQAASGLLSHLRITRMQIGQLMAVGRKNETPDQSNMPIAWSVLLAASLGASGLLLWNITNSLNQTLVVVSTATLCIPLLFSILAFYKCLFLWMHWVRKNKGDSLYRGNRIYLVAQALSKLNTDLRLNAVLSICLLFSAVCFVIGMVIGYTGDLVFSAALAQWMSFVQMSLSVTFIVIYFSILSVKQIVNTQDNQRALQLMGYLGRSRQQLQGLLLGEACLSFTTPVLACGLVLAMGTVPVNAMLNGFLPQTNLVIYGVGIFSVCFCSLYLLYLAVVYRLARPLY